MRLRWPGMRWTKAALALFGIGLMLGFVVVVLGGHPRLERVASALMTLGLLALPLGLFADGSGLALLGRIAARLSRGKSKKAKAKPRAPAARRKPAGRPAAKPRTPSRAPRRKRR